LIIGLVRHGETDWNATGRIQGQTDIPLNEAGIRQARALADRLKSEDRIWDAVVSSDLKRARETARVLADALGVPLLPPDPRIRERSFGLAEGTTEEERLRRWGADWRSLDVGQESDEDVRKRGLAFLADWQAARPDIRLLVVSHGSIIAVMLQSLFSGLEDRRIGNMSLSILETDGAEWRISLHNCSKHLDTLEARS
jgi:probable phosphoglycerate mutase